MFTYFQKLLKNPILLTNSVRRRVNVSIQNKPSLLEETIQRTQINSPSDWKLIRQELLKNSSHRGQISENNIDSIILGYCIGNKQFNLGNLYINFLKDENIKFNLAITGKYFKLLYLLNEKQFYKEGKKISKDQEEFILKLYKDLRKENKILDSFSLENAILALSITKEWEKCIDLLKEVKLLAIPNSYSYSVISAAAFINTKDTISWNLLNEAINHNRSIIDIVYFAYINSIQKLRKSVNIITKLEELFYFLQNNDITIESNEVLLKLNEVANNKGLKSSITNISDRGYCKICEQHLENRDINESEFKELQDGIFKNVIVGKDIFVKTNPQELENFKQFINKQEEFDVILDGLNISYSAGTKHSPVVFAALIASVVAHFVKDNKKVLVIGRHHMNKWPKQYWNYVTNNSTVFLTQDISQDDPYLLYCALKSGKDTIIVTRDLMRGHKFLLKSTKLRILFNRWLSQRQHHLLKVVGNGNPVFRKPPDFSLTAQKNGDSWHIPFKTIKDKEDLVWLCLKCQ